MRHAVGWAALVFVTSCTQVRGDERTTADTNAADDSGAPGTAADAADDSSEEPRLDLGAQDGSAGDDGGPGSCPPTPGGDATLTGVVTAPNGTLPISGAVVWVQDAMPEGVPDHVYCLECVEIPCDMPHAITEPDGSFTLAVPPGPHTLVVQKGQFMRASSIVAEAGVQPLDVEVTRLPGERAPEQGQWIPNIALAWGDYDALQDALAKLGLGELDATGKTLDPGTETFDVWDNHGQGNVGVEPQNPITTMSLGTLEDLVSDPDALARYHIVFVPCASGDAAFSDAQLANIRDWVAAGGKWYVADWSLAWIDEPFHQYQTFWQDGFTGGPYLDAFDTVGHVRDDALAAWLAALPAEFVDINPLNPGGGHPTLDALPDVGLVDLWSTIHTTPSVLVDDGMGGTVDVGHKVWIDGPGGGEDGAPADTDWPLTVTGHYGCGKIMFTSYHTTEWSTYVGLTPQELVLMYLVLEIGTCQVAYEPPPPVG